jgi:hypothetical protein
MGNRFLRIISALVFLAPSHAQTTTATLFGVVHDSTGAVVPQARVTAKNMSTSFTRTADTDENGSYLITNLPVGPYSVSVEKGGFRRFVQDGITLEVDANARVDAVLSVGQVSETVNVTAEATGVDTRSSTVGEVIDRVRIQELPLKGRNVMELARGVPGVARASAPAAVSQARSGPSIVVAGGRDTENEIRFDGTSHKSLLQNTIFNLPSPDALQEFKVLTSNFSAEYGRFAGGLFVAVTRAGTNDIHGSVWEYLRNKALNARNFFSVDKPDLKQNQFGFTAGGPLVRNRTFAFGSYQGTRIRQSQLFATARPPTADERTGDFSASSRRPNDPLNNQPFANGRIPASRFDGVAAKLLDRYIPLPNTADGRFVMLVPRPTDGDQYLLRVDHNFSPRNSINLRYFRDTTQLQFQTGDISSYVTSLQQMRVTNWALQDTHTFSASLLNEFRIGLDRFDSPTVARERTQLSDLGAVYPGVIIPQMPTINTSGYFSLGSNDAFSDAGNIYQIGDNLRWFRGRHSLSFGGEFARNEYFGRGYSANQGVFTLDGSITRNAFADFLIGKPASLDQSSPYERLVKGYDWYLFAQDDVRISRRFTLNAGLRYQYFRAYKSIYDRVNTYSAGQQSRIVAQAPPGMLFPGDAGVKPNLIDSDKNNFAPRLGFAWDPMGNGRLGVRGSYGLFFEDHRSDPWIYPAVNQPFVIRKFLFNPFSLTDPYRGQEDPFPYIYSPQNARFSYPMGLFTVSAPVVHSPYVHHLSFTVEKALPANTVFKIGYVGKLGHNLLRMNQKNPAVYVPGKSTIANTDDRRIILPGIYSNFREIAGNSNSAYHSLQVVVNKRLNRGITVRTSYTFGKFIDYYSATNLGQFPQDPFNQRADRSRSDEDRAHIFNTSVYYEIPAWRQQTSAIGKALGGWTLSGMISAVSGGPIHIRSGQDYSLTGVGWDRPDLVGSAQRSHSSRDDFIQNFFNTAAFVANQAGRYGNTGRNIISGPAQSTTDISIVKSFPISERLGRLQFRSEFFNLWNQVSFSQPEARLNNRNFGRIQSAGDPRIVQFALRYSF